MDSDIKIHEEFQKRLIRYRWIRLAIVLFVAFSVLLKTRLEKLEMPLFLFWLVLFVIIWAAEIRNWKCPACKKSLGGRYSRSNHPMRSCPRCGINFYPQKAIPDLAREKLKPPHLRSKLREPDLLRACLIAFVLFGGFLFFGLRGMRQDHTTLVRDLIIAMAGITLIMYIASKVHHKNTCRSCGTAGQFNEHCDQCGCKM